MTPSAVSAMHQRIRATASACPPWRCSIAGARLRRNGVAVKPKYELSLTNSEMDSVAPFTGLLLGQPTLRRRIKLGAFAALDQRIALRYGMPGMTEPETRDYLSHHLKLAGRSDQLFSDDAAALIHQTGRGLPRAINNLGLQALVATYAANKTIVDTSAARAAVAEVTAE